MWSLVFSRRDWRIVTFLWPSSRFCLTGAMRLLWGRSWGSLDSIKRISLALSAFALEKHIQTLWGLVQSVILGFEGDYQRSRNRTRTFYPCFLALRTSRRFLVALQWSASGKGVTQGPWPYLLLSWAAEIACSTSGTRARHMSRLSVELRLFSLVPNMSWPSSLGDRPERN